MAVDLKMCKRANPNTKRAMCEALIESNPTASPEEQVSMLVDEVSLDRNLAANYQSIVTGMLMLEAHEVNAEYNGAEPMREVKGLAEALGKPPVEVAVALKTKGSGDARKEEAFTKEQQAVTNKLTDDELEAKIDKQFSDLEEIVNAVITANGRAAIINGNGGLGKSYHTEKVDRELGGHAEWVKGTISAPNLFVKLWDNREPGQVLVIDDCDAPLFDEDSLKILLSATDTKAVREVSYVKKSPILSDADCPNKFEFRGAVIVITNVDLEAQSRRGTKLSPTQEALLTRAHYIDVMLRTERERKIRALSVLKHGMLQDQYGFEDHEVETLTNFYSEVFNNLRENSLRSIVKMAELYNASPNNWQSLVRSSMFKKGLRF